MSGDISTSVLPASGGAQPSILPVVHGAGMYTQPLKILSEISVEKMMVILSVV
jgi:hypothetical protein